MGQRQSSAATPIGADRRDWKVASSIAEEAWARGESAREVGPARDFVSRVSSRGVTTASAPALLLWADVGAAGPRERPARITVLGRAELLVEIAIERRADVDPLSRRGCLRFARLMRYRPDKDAADVDTIDALRVA